MSRRARTLSAEERRLWAEIARLVRPLRSSGAAATILEPAKPPAPHSPPPVPPVPGAPEARRAPQDPPPLAPLDRKMLRALGRGRIGVDASLDLHGLTQAAAHLRLAGFLRSAQASGHRLVLVVTGRGSLGQGGERGVLRRNVPHWLRLPEFRSVVSGFEEAGPRQGGEGALYVRLRRRAQG